MTITVAALLVSGCSRRDDESEQPTPNVLAARQECNSSAKPVDCLLRIANAHKLPDMEICKEAADRAHCIHNDNTAALCAGISVDKNGHCHIVYD